MSGLSQVPMPGNQKARRSWGRAVWAFILCIPNPGIGLVYARRWTLGVAVGGVMLAIQVLLVLLTERLDPNKYVLLIFLGLVGLIAVMSLGFAIGCGFASRFPRVGTLQAHQV